MNIVKLHATTSTNDELKSRFRESVLPHLTAIYSLKQTRGKGQQGAQWVTEDGKNLTFSVLITEGVSDLTPFLINQVVSVSIVEWLKNDLQIQSKIKWPNDILSVNHKLAGILIENSYSGNFLSSSVVGIGLNVNQVEFEGLPKAISLKNITGKEFELEVLLISFLNVLKNNLRDPLKVAQDYNKYLFKYRQVISFESSNAVFNGRVEGTDKDGKLILRVDNELKIYDLKELKWMY
ncbi:BirA family biotin operon repressor/biotin-[acetyl-CoA-carboxylase] ligase [Nonlabens xylanidelens]|uniref:BirA family biotin operon repressor/biotin-[acetyl-CoA-carboxylase] ligase n=1 Tax=Nonlabens xylanidelens TaxID=191564 RepID=A0A2S6IJK1_9FLAO|nr:biotin--[acetyl-CoA-carboxylase] ligase [Nonlabens xylanidelens]PPK94361.1 BirA family biotin operon repressor/biotin-[acetyl-CoA-carboxylase] ligase [Nonlabens xylanidelens]PQJ18705.1 biotin--[acetyl-CoA-carboxylase] ligase [Nonlabens xylanidelens]PQJ18894.1 biotin--[acetyl-CoA-carboxylase] ligase [Nonlabens xylanidelens]